MEFMRRQFHGYREESDGSHVTTEFVALWFLPLWPVASYRVLGKEESQSNTENKKLPIQWGQALQGWLFLFAVVGGLIFIAGFLYAGIKYGWSV